MSFSKVHAPQFQEVGLDEEEEEEEEEEEDEEDEGKDEEEEEPLPLEPPAPPPDRGSWQTTHVDDSGRFSP